jgi:F0F1-type ATP synthase gamma subunit
MAESLKRIKARISGIEKVGKVAHAMEMISIAKIRHIQNQLLISRRYFSQIDTLLKDLVAADRESIAHPFFQERLTKKKIALCIVTSDVAYAAVIILPLSA